MDGDTPESGASRARYKRKPMTNITQEIIEELMKNACEYQGKCLEAREKTRQYYKTQEKEGENTLRIFIDGLMAKIAQEQASNKINNTTEKTSYQIILSTSFIRTHYLINDLFMQGDIIEALTLIRKQFETLARMHEIDSKPLLKLHKKTPNVCNIFKKAGKVIYPRLSGGMYVSLLREDWPSPRPAEGYASPLC